MGREIKRVALAFDWPLDAIWTGFLNPHYRPCDACEGGWSLGYKRLEAFVRPLLAAATKPQEDGLVDLVHGLCGEPSFLPFGYSSSDVWNACEKVVKAAGLDWDSWHRCPVCLGHGVHPDTQEAYEAWKPTAPPTGEGWQLWETTSEGSPITPVFATPEDLARHCADDGVSSFGSCTQDYDTWLAFAMGPGWAPSAIVTEGEGLRSGVEALTEKKVQKK